MEEDVEKQGRTFKNKTWKWPPLQMCTNSHSHVVFFENILYKSNSKQAMKNMEKVTMKKIK